MSSESPDNAPPKRRKRRRRRRGRRPDQDGQRPGGGDAPPSKAKGDPGEDDGGKRRRRRRRRRRGRDTDASGKPPAREARRDDAPRKRPSGPRPSTDELDAGWGAPAAPAPEAPDDSGSFEQTDERIAWGDDSDAPTPDVHLEADLPADPGPDDPDPVTAPLEDDIDATLEDAPDRIRNVVGIKFAPAGKIYRYDAGDLTCRRGETVVVEGDRGVRVGTVAVDSIRRPHGRGNPKRVLRRPNTGDERVFERNEERAAEALGLARDTARELKLPIKVFRAQYAHSGKKVMIYFTSEERVDFRELVRALSRKLNTRVEMRQTGVRDEAKMVGGIGSCGQELCCTTWLPEFVPVSIKMAKDQGMVLNPSKVSGQCGRLKCCLVYEQETYATLRKGMPKLGKRILTPEGTEGRVVEVDVLKQRIRVSLITGDFEYFGKGEVKPMFPSQKQPKKKR